MPHTYICPKTQTAVGMSINPWATRHLYKSQPFQTPAKKMIPAVKRHPPVNNIIASKTDEIIQHKIKQLTLKILSEQNTIFTSKYFESFFSVCFLCDFFLLAQFVFRQNM
jgi:hypothetical protein